MEFQIRSGTTEDIKDINFVNRKTWKTSYIGLIDQDFLDKLETDITEERIKVIKGAMTKGDSAFVVALAQNQIVGMIRYSKSSADKTLREAEIRAFYILEEYQKMGLGTKMLSFAAKEMLEAGYKKLVICCLDKNPANQFYIKAGGVKTCTRSFRLDGKTYQDNMYYFADLRTLLV